MESENKNLELFASCPHYIEPILNEELKSLGLANTKLTSGGVLISANLEEAYKIYLWSRTASRLFVKLANFAIPSKNFSEENLYSFAYSIDWQEHFSVHNTIAVSTFSNNNNIQNNLYASLKVKDAVCDYFRKLEDARPDVDSKNPDIALFLYVGKKEASIYLDISGGGLHRRGYRRDSVTAPLRENLAAAILLKSSWDKMASKNESFYDPMCGSGTLVIEAVLIALKIAPGLLNEKYGFVYWKKHEQSVWQKQVKEAKNTCLYPDFFTDNTDRTDNDILTDDVNSNLNDDISTSLDRSEKFTNDLPKFFASDIDMQSVGICTEALERLGLDDLVKVFTSDYKKLEESPYYKELLNTKGLLCVNPPYGKRLENTSEKNINAFYSNFGKWLSEKFSGWKAAVLAGDKNLAKALGLRADKLNNFYNGNLECLLANFTLDENNFFSDTMQLKTSVIINDDPTSGVSMILNRLKKNRKALKKYLAKNDISCYRIYDADIPQYSAAIDIYTDNKSTLYAVVQEYAAPSTIDEHKAKKRLKELVGACAHFFELPSEQIYVKKRKKQKGKEQYNKLATEIKKHIVAEGGHEFYVNFDTYLDTGIFLDHRISRKTIFDLCKGKSFLNLFAYTCSASVYAAKGGATSTLSVDTSNTYLHWGKSNFELNNILAGAVEGTKGRHTSSFSNEKVIHRSSEKQGKKYKIKLGKKIKHRFLKEDSLSFLQNSNEKFDVIFLDPPTFSNRKGDTVFDLQKDHAKLIELAIESLNKNGVLLFSNNFRKFQLEESIIDKYKVKDISLSSIPEDFSRNKKIHKSYIITR